jgi:four helix bundle protein
MQNAECRIVNGEMPMAPYRIQERAFHFACRIVVVHHKLSRSSTVRPLLSQLLRAGTGVGSSLEEAEGGQSKADFIAKCRISLKEARESLYWLRLLSESGVVRRTRLADLPNEANEIVAILTTIVRKASLSPDRGKPK